MNKKDWTYKKFEDCIEKVKYTTKIQSVDYGVQGKYPVVSQEEELISGYWDNDADVFHITKPVVIFGDHTRVLKYVDFDFVLGADGVKILQPTEEINAKFLLYYLIWYKVPSLGYSRHYKLLKELSIPVPPLPTQRAIVAELDTLNEILDKKRQQLKELDTLAQSIFYDMFGDPVENEKGWEVKKMGEVCDSVSYGTSSPACENGKYKYLRMNNLTYSGYIDLSNVKTINLPDESYEKYVVRKDDILFNRTNSRELVGKTALFNLDEEMIIAGYIIRVRVHQHEVLPVFIVKYMNTPFIKDYLYNLCKGAVNQANINSKELQNIPLYVPPLFLQQSFARKVEAIEKQKNLINASIKEMETLFNATMDKYFG